MPTGNAHGAAAGFHHPAVRAARLLHQRKHRQQRRCFLVEGPTAIEAVLTSQWSIGSLFVTAEAKHREPLAARAAECGASVFLVDERTMRSLSQTRSPQGAVAVAPFVHREISALAAFNTGSACFAVALHQVSDPGNAGTLIRSAEAFGAVAICCAAAGVDPYNEKVVRASMGALFHVPLLLYASFEELGTAARAAGFIVAAADAAAPDVRSVTVPRACLLVIGHERRGLSDLPPADVGLRVGIPQTARAESLNAAVAGSILMYEIARANRAASPERTTAR